jgi:hypothetical protein
MNKNFKSYLSIWVVLLVVFNAITFIVPFENKFQNSFWISYILILVAFVGQLFCSNLFFKEENKGKTFLNLPIMTISYSGLVASMVLGTLCMVISAIPSWLGAVVGIVILVVYSILVLQAKWASDTISNTDSTIKSKTLYIKSLSTDFDTLISQISNEEIKGEVKKVADVCRYSDPISNEALSNVEGQITIKFSELKGAVSENNFEIVKTICNELNILLTDRNNKCKLLK